MKNGKKMMSVIVKMQKKCKISIIISYISSKAVWPNDALLLKDASDAKEPLVFLFLYDFLMRFSGPNGLIAIISFSILFLNNSSFILF